jgi:predicted CXXCH cytochrome family protein
VNRRTAIISGSLALALVLVAVGFTMPPDQRPTTRVTDCTTGGCHADVIKFQYLHAPVAVDACEICHVYDDPAQHRFKLIEQHDNEPICSFCHIGKTTFGRGDNWVGLHVHEPVQEGDCIACHNPHGSNLRNLIAADTVGTLCSAVTITSSINRTCIRRSARRNV